MRRLFSALVLLLAGLSPAFAQQHVPTYFGSVINHTTATGATDVVCLEGGAGKVSKLAGFAISGSAASPVVISISILRRVTLNTGTSFTVASASGSPTHQPATSTMKVWSTNPTALGTADPAGSVFRRIRWDIDTKVSAPVGVGLLAATAANPYTTQPEARGATQAICMNYNGVAQVTTMDISMVWTETSD